YVRSTYRLTLAQRNPCVKGCVGSPATRTARPCSTVTSIAHVSGQSCGHAPRTTCASEGGVMGAVTTSRVDGARVEYSATCRLPASGASVRGELPCARPRAGHDAGKRLRCLMLNR